MTALSGALLPSPSGRDYEGEIGPHVLAGFYADGRLSIDADGVWVGTLRQRAIGHYVGPLTLAGIEYEAVATPIGYGMPRGWAITLHRGVA